MKTIATVLSLASATFAAGQDAVIVTHETRGLKRRERPIERLAAHVK